MNKKVTQKYLHTTFFRNSDGKVTKDEFVQTCLGKYKLSIIILQKATIMIAFSWQKFAKSSDTTAARSSPDITNE